MTALANVQVAKTPLPTDIPVINLSGADIPADAPVHVDTTAGNQMGTGTNQGIPIIPFATDTIPCLGTTMEIIKNGASGRVRPVGIGTGVCDGGVTAGTFVDPSATANRSIKTHVAAKCSLGIALATGADGETIPFLYAIAKNA